MEKPLAQAAGSDGRASTPTSSRANSAHGCFSAAIFTASDLPRDEPDADHCGSCRDCQDICPTAAFPAPYKLDPRRCISYLTIEHKGPIPHEFRKAIGTASMGCDDCLAVCPWNKFAQTGREANSPRARNCARRLWLNLVRLDGRRIPRAVCEIPVKRIGRDRFVRNVLIAIGNSGEASMAVATEPLLGDASPLVRGAAVWALSQLLARDEFATRAADAVGTDADEGVREEWQLASTAA